MHTHNARQIADLERIVMRNLVSNFGVGCSPLACWLSVRFCSTLPRAHRIDHQKNLPEPARTCPNLPGRVRARSAAAANVLTC